ncbi:MAG: hypothetical protein ACP5OR_08590 [Candidatus Dormibacteria bacterium]
MHEEPPKDVLRDSLETENASRLSNPEVVSRVPIVHWIAIGVALILTLVIVGIALDFASQQPVNNVFSNISFGLNE